jgi:hypothetical protein
MSSGDGVRLRNEGRACSECHRRGAPILTGAGLYTDFRRRVLEDLSLRPRLGASWR